jgi:hypothetical protein
MPNEFNRKPVAAIQSEGKASCIRNKREGAEMPNEFNRKPSPKLPFSRKGKRRVEERRERAHGVDRGQHQFLAQKAPAHPSSYWVPLLPYHHGMNQEYLQFSFPPLICECVFLTVDDVTGSATKCLSRNFWQARPFPIFQCCIPWRSDWKLSQHSHEQHQVVLPFPVQSNNDNDHDV